MPCCAFSDSNVATIRHSFGFVPEILCLFLENAYSEIPYAFRSTVVISLSTNCLVTS